MKYVGLTDDPMTRRQAHGNPFDWNERPFDDEKHARLWEETMLACGYKGEAGGEGWKYGYTYTITKDTKEPEAFKVPNWIAL